MGAAQVIVIVLLVLRIAVGAFRHGETQKVDCLANLISALIWAMLLSAGGFWEK